MSSSLCYFTNLERLLQCFTPDLPKKILPKSCLNDVNKQWLPIGKDRIEYFTLKDLWECYDEWSVYGAGTPLVLKSGDTLTQFYIPFLSAIQIYTNNHVQAPSPRNGGVDNDGVGFESDSSSDSSGSGDLCRSSRKSDSSSDDGGGSGGLYRSSSSGNNSSKEWDDTSYDSSSDQVPKEEILGYLNFQYTETTQPFLRVPLAEKIAELAKCHPALMTLKSVDLSPASWMAVAWYPIYAIPTQQNETCFITYHSLSSSFEDCANKYDEIDLGEDICCPSGWGSIIGEKLERKKSDYTSLSPFGLATYRFHGDFWLSPSHDNEKLSDLFGAAESWLKQINAVHHDFNFFIDNNNL
ncbi:hypothetical protein TanjilG_15080 [Lupinus angustifolius]|uniref:uncharacterized protein LOC109335364 n=1 Tax=Lupinus angustifolius TaxID=3871 RepID=UPI00090E13EA|nr:PREDICTED: uncharacterized protein LOC109335364 [Lupinus angustifolius]OIV90694.1 hypothetical protein TanjilG_15080 [Lupinus angustifolius]